jgi:hypothetical protein
MKKIFLYIAFTFSILMMMQSCQKDVASSLRAKQVTVDTAIQAGTDFYLNLAQYGYDDDIATIVQQGTKYIVSQIEDNSDLFTSVYHYSTAENVTGTDRIVLSIKESPVGGQTFSKDSTLVYINLTINK